MLRDVPEHVRSISNSANNTKSPSIRDSCSELRTCSHVHARKHDRVIDFEEVGDRCANLFCVRHQPAVQIDSWQVVNEKEDERGEAMVEMDEWDERIRGPVSSKRQSSYAGTMQLPQISKIGNREKGRRRRTITIVVRC